MRKRGAQIQGLTDQQKVFVMECLADDQFNFTEAAKKAGYKNPSQAAYKLLKQPAIKAAIGKALHDRMYRCEVDADRVLRELMEIGFADPIDMFDENGTLLSIADMPESMRRAISSFEVSVVEDEEGWTTTTAKVRLNPKISALELIARHLGMLNDKLNMQHGLDHSLLGNLLTRVESGRIGGSRPAVVDGSVIEDKVATAKKAKAAKPSSNGSNGSE